MSLLQNVDVDASLREELDALVHPVLQGRMESEHWCSSMYSDRGIPIKSCIQYLWAVHAIWVNEWTVASIQWTGASVKKH